MTRAVVHVVVAVGCSVLSAPSLHPRSRLSDPEQIHQTFSVSPPRAPCLPQDCPHHPVGE